MSRKKGNKPELSPQEKEIQRLFTLAKNRLTLGQIKTLDDLCKVLGSDLETLKKYKRNFAEWYPSSPISFQLINELRDTILSELRRGAEATPKEENPSILPTGGALGDTIGELKPQKISPTDGLQTSAPPLLPSLTFPPRNPKQVANLIYYQENTCRDIWRGIQQKNIRGLLLRCNTREGKTYAIAQILRWLVDSKYFEGKTLSPYRIFFVTKPTLIEQSRRVLENEFGLDPIDDFFITNYDSLRASLGKQFIKENEIVRMGEVFYEYEWKPGIYPLVVVWDECQGLKNEGSEQSKVAQAYQNLLDKDPNILQIFSSATPFSRVSQAKVFAVATRIPFKFGMGEKPLNNLTWPTFAAEELCVPGANPYQYSKANMKLLMEKFKPYIFTFKNVRYKYRANNRTEVIDFPSPEIAKQYILAWEEYVKEKIRLERNMARNSGFLVLAQFTIYRKKAERLRYKIIAERIWRAVNERGKAALVACAFKGTIVAVVTELYRSYGIPRDKISLIWGGDSAFTQTKRELYTDEEIMRVLKSKEEDIDRKQIKEILKQLEYTSGNLDQLPPNFDLGPQSREKRQEEVDKFQSGASDYCLFTFGAGGVGLSLHQYKSSLKPRETIVTPIFNEMEMIQALGRAHGPNSLSVTEQSILLFKDTIEEAVLGIYRAKKSALDVVMEEGKEGGGAKLDEKFREVLMELRNYQEDQEEEEKGFLTESDYSEIEQELEESQQL
jgi:hypothetical protein